MVTEPTASPTRYAMRTSPSIQLLMDEHQDILRTLESLAGFCRQVALTPLYEQSDMQREQERGRLAAFVAFFQRFADAHHHKKEEEILFAAMLECGFPRDHGPIAVMLNEHDIGRAHVRFLKEASVSTSSWDTDRRQAIATHGFAFVEILRAHIQKEDQVLYPMAMARLPPDVMARVDDASAAVEAKARADGTHAKLVALGAKARALSDGPSA